MVETRCLIVAVGGYTEAGEEARMIQEVLDWSWSHQYKLTLVEYRYRWLHMEMCVDM